MKLNSILLTLTTACLMPSFATASQSKLKPLPDNIETQPLVEITNDRDRAISNMALMIDAEERVTGLYTETETPRGIDENNIYPLKELQSSKGIVVEERDGRDVIRLQGKVDDERGRAQLTIRYLTNGLFGQYKLCKLVAKRDTSGQWQAENPETGRSVRRVHIVTHSLGIKRLQGACD